MELELCASASFGLEAVLKREIEALGYTVTRSSDGRISYMADERGIVRSNLWLRTADRVYLRMAEFCASSFEELFQQTAALEWEKLIPIDGRFTVIGSSVKSVLHSVPACQSIIKKAVVNRLSDFYGVEWLEESGAEYTIRFSFLKDVVTIMVDTSGEGLHKRGYRVNAVTAPIKETLASALIQLSFFKDGRYMVDPCCGSGTLPIEAAMLAMNIAPGISRKFASEEWELIKKEIWKDERKKAFEAIRHDCSFKIDAFDIDPACVYAAKENALEAGVADYIEFNTRSIHKSLSEISGTSDRGMIITNPPYGHRIGEQKQMDMIYKDIRNFAAENPTWSVFVITSDDGFEKKFGRKADRRRKLFNGNIQSCYYQYHGTKGE